jgi:hypothetical protein
MKRRFYPYDTARRHIPEMCRLHTRRCRNVHSHKGEVARVCTQLSGKCTYRRRGGKVQSRSILTSTMYYVHVPATLFARKLSVTTAHLHVVVTSVELWSSGTTAHTLSYYARVIFYVIRKELTRKPFTFLPFRIWISIMMAQRTHYYTNIMLDTPISEVQLI